MNAPQPATATGTRIKRLLQEYRWSLLFVWAPTLLTALYYVLFAADLYASEARFIVRTPSHMQATGITSLLQGTGISRGQDDVYAVQDFVLSRDALGRLEKQVDLRGLFNRPEADFLSRYPNLVYDSRTEEFYKYYQTRVGILYDTTTGVTTLMVKAFRPEDAQQVASLLLREGESLVNRLNERAHENAVHEAQVDVELAERRVTAAQDDLLAYRSREILLDPAKTSGALLETQARLQGELSASRTRLAELERASPGSPLRSNLESHIDALNAQIAALGGRLAGGDNAMAPKLSEYEQLMLKRDFADKELASAMGSLEAARAESRRQSTYLDRVVEPNLPDKAEYPKRARNVLIVLLSCAMAYAIGKLLYAGLREHSQV